MRTDRCVSVLLIASCLVSLIWQGRAQGRSLAEIEDSGVIRICLAGSTQDFYKTNAAAFVRYLGSGVRGEFIRFSQWNDQFRNRDGLVVHEDAYTPEPMASGRCDLYPNDLVRLAWREKKLDYVVLFVSRNTIIVNKRQKNAIRTMDDLAGRTAAVMEGTSFHTWLEGLNRDRFRDNPMTLVFMPQEAALKAVDAGDVDFGVSGADGALWAVNHVAQNAAVAFPAGPATEYGWCVRKGDKKLQEAVRRFFYSAETGPDLGPEPELETNHWHDPGRFHSLCHLGIGSLKENDGKESPWTGTGINEILLVYERI